VFKVPSDTNLFERLPFITINFVMAYTLVLYSIFISIKEHTKTKKTVFITVMIFVFLPLIASIVQALNYGLIIMYPILTLSTIVVYLFLETQSASKDYLTGAYSRSRFDEFVDRKIASNEEFCVVMLDLDDYKIFNDEHGHTVGDRILIQYANQAKQVFGDRSLFARYGGDEFVVLVPGKDIEELMRLNGQLKDSIKHSKDPIFSKLRYSFGQACRTIENQYTYDDLLIEADKVMYKNKAINKNFKRRKEDMDVKIKRDGE
jgi:diguanylate cyclase (GGDEF)-like protein